MPKPYVVRGTAAAGLSVALVAAMTGLAPTAQARTVPHTAARVALAKTAPGWLAKAHRVGATATGAQQAATVYLSPAGGEAALAAAVTAQGTPGSATFHKYLTPAQYYAKYAPTAAQLNAVTAYLKSQGLRVTGTDSHNRFVTVSGTVAAADKAFGVTIQRYTHDGQTVTAPNGPVTLPSTVAGSVLSVTGLDSTKTKVTTQQSTGDTPSSTATAATVPDSAPPAAYRNARPCSQTYGSLSATYEQDFSTPLPEFQGKTLPYAVCGYTGTFFRAAYEGALSTAAGGTLDGTGITVGIVDAYDSPTITSDTETYADRHGDGSYADGQYTSTDFAPFTHTAANDCDASGWYSEQSLDVEAVHAMAPGADIHYYGSKSCYDADFIDALRQTADDDAVQVVSNSWGDTGEQEDAGSVNAYEQVFLQGASEGITYQFSSGDNGDELAATGINTADYPASDPYVTAVGGTSTGIDGNGDTVLQAGWGTDSYSLSKDGTSWTGGGFLYGAGGGYSDLFNRPSYQNGVVPSSDEPGRAVPDVAMDADPNTGMLIGLTQTNPDGTTSYGEYRIGGTSLASPLFAGMVALHDQQIGVYGSGFLNPSIYAEAGSSNFSDVVGDPADAGNVRVNYVNSYDPSAGYSYSVRTFGDDSSLPVRKGWDPVTGVGVPTTVFLTTTNEG